MNEQVEVQPIRPHHVSIEIGDILHVFNVEYLITGIIQLGMPIREITLKVQEHES
jgi:hypothetical protein